MCKLRYSVSIPVCLPTPSGDDILTKAATADESSNKCQKFYAALYLYNMNRDTDTKIDESTWKNMAFVVYYHLKVPLRVFIGP